ncbi:MAG: glycosyltransferase family 4 protein [Oscillospiraceae bacterium]|nr:glycosyltransferase family 4 protein [Oscillospiraceae bacterium]
MRVLHVIAQLPMRTGSGVYYSNLVEELKKYGHEQAASFATQDGCCFDILEAHSQYPVCFKSRQLPFPIAGMSDVMPYESTVYSSMDESMIKAWSGAFEETLVHAKSDFRPDAVILHHLWMLTSIACGIFDKEIKIGVCHNTDIRQAEQHCDMKNRYVTNLGGLDAVLSLSDAQKEKITETFGIPQSRSVAIGGGFNQKLFFPYSAKPKNGRVEIVFSAKIERSKGIFELVKAFKMISENRPNLHLDIIGTPTAENAERLSSTVGAAGNIALVPITSQAALADYIRDKDIFVMPSYFEGLGLMAIECLASGLRVVATEIEALRALLGKRINCSGTIEYVPLPRIYDTDKPFEEDIEQFIEGLSTKLLKQIERVEKGEPFPDGILDEVAKHSWSGIAERINDLIERLAAAQCP